MKLQEIDTIQDLREWVADNMKGAEVRVDMHGTVIIHTHLIDTAGGYLYPQEEEA